MLIILINALVGPFSKGTYRADGISNLRNAPYVVLLRIFIQRLHGPVALLRSVQSISSVVIDI